MEVGEKTRELRRLSTELHLTAQRVSAGIQPPTALQVVATKLQVALMDFLPEWEPLPKGACVKPTHEAANAFWQYWKENGETHKHGYYESTWGAINAALAHGWEPPKPAPVLSIAA